MNTLHDSEQTSRREPDARAPFLQRLFCRRMLVRGLFVAACLATLIGLFYAVENWRGKRAWEKCRRELEARGEVIDWNAFIPAPVSDEENVFKAPKMAEWFVRGPLLDSFHVNPLKPSKVQTALTPLRGREPTTDSVLVAEVKVVPPAAQHGREQRDAVLRLDDPAAREQAEKLLAAAIGPCVEGPIGCPVLARPLDKIKPARWVVEAEAAPTPKAVREFFLRSSGSHTTATPLAFKYLEVAPAGSNQFRVSLNRRVYSAAAYLAWTQPQEADFNSMREGLERPQARIDGNYQQPFARPMPDFVMLRTVAQRLAQRAQCYLLLRQPEAAWHELALVRDLCRMLEAKPAGDCATLVQDMIDVAITGLYTGIVQDGLRLQVWREPELAAIQKQLAEIDFIPRLYRGLQAERAASCRTFEVTPPAELANLFSFYDERRWLWDRLKDPRFLLLRFAPRGWLYQNMCANAIREELLLGLLDVPNNQVLPRIAEGVTNQLQAALSHFTPYTFLGVAVVHNLVRASQTMARNQALANEAFIACGLERYRLAHGQYPDTVEALVPQFAEKLPHDLIGGQPLKYHRTADGRFVLYSIGWNEKDDGGVPGKTGTEGDWVWQ